MSYKTYNDICREQFGCKVYKLSIDGGFTCPNRDGTVGTGGCIFCSGAGGGEFAAGGPSVREQLENAKRWVAQKNRSGKYIAYFQSFTGTYGPVQRLERLYREAIAPDEIVGLSIGTRPDCLGEDVVALLERINRKAEECAMVGNDTGEDMAAEGLGMRTFLLTDCLINRKDAPLDRWPHGGFEALNAWLETL